MQQNPPQLRLLGSRSLDGLWTSQEGLHYAAIMIEIIIGVWVSAGGGAFCGLTSGCRAYNVDNG